jgi:uncharacterized OsmC-like protein
MLKPNLMRDRQRPLVNLYKEEPAAAMVTDVAFTEWSNHDPLHSSVVVGPHEPIRVPVALHTAVGGDSDEAVPGDILCAALASCLDSTLRVIANRMGVELLGLKVVATAQVDVRGTLLVSNEVRVGFQDMQVRVQLQLPDEVPQQQRAQLLQLAEGCCVVLDTLRRGVPVNLQLEEGS